MEKSVETMVDLRKEVISICLGGEYNSSEIAILPLTPCTLTLEKLPTSMQQSICSNPLYELLNEKNIFTLGENIFKQAAIDKLGCDLLTKLILKPLQLIQKAACQLVDPAGERSIIPVTQGIESIKKNSCSLSLATEVKTELTGCLPDYNLQDDLEEYQQNLLKNLILCKDKINSLPIGSRIKMCDDILSALSLHTINRPGGVNSPFKLRIAGADGKVTESNLLISLRMQRRLNNLDVEYLMLEKLLQYRRLEKIACVSLERKNNPFAEGKPLNQLLDKVCFTRTEQKKPDSVLQVDSCVTYTKKLDEEDRNLLCNETETTKFYDFFKFKRFFNEGIQRFEQICNKTFEPKFISAEEIQESQEEAIDQVMLSIKESNQTEGISFDVLQQVHTQNQNIGLVNYTVNTKKNLLEQNQTKDNDTVSDEINEQRFSAYTANTFNVDDTNRSMLKASIQAVPKEVPGTQIIGLTTLAGMGTVLLGCSFFYWHKLRKPERITTENQSLPTHYVA